MKISRTDNTNFRGIHIANAATRVNGVSNNFKLYKITDRDTDFLQNMYQKFNLRELMPRLSEQEVDIWTSVFRKAVDSSVRPNQTAFLIATDNKPCGLAVSSVGYYNRYKLNQICTLPVEPGKRVVLAGKTLFRPIFDAFLASGCKDMELEALKFGPFSPVTKYLQMGFGMYGGSDYVELMRINRAKAEKTLKQLDELISYSPVQSRGEVSQSLKDVDLLTNLYC
ncbi:MAG: hypothetical protein NC390_00415 [Fusobacterium sp.]|nr:hypothetical protein [Fusobacterium sp.]